jgi:hypothetical protein
VQRQTNQMPAWLISSGAVVGVVAAIVTEARRKYRRTHRASAP